MPFTFSHPAIVLPLTYLPQRWFSLTGLVVGSLTPDFEYFLRMRIQSDYSHSMGGLFWFDLPLGLLLAFVFQQVVRNPLCDNLPHALKSRLLIFNHFQWSAYFKANYMVVIFSLLIGAVSHILWDSFTHQHGYFVQAIPALREEIHLAGMQIPAFKLLQHTSTFIGAFFIALALYKLPKDETLKRPLNLKYWGVFIILCLAVISIRLFCGLSYLQYGHVIVTAISAGLISFIITPFLIKKEIKT